MARRERRKCSACAKTGHNSRTCPVAKKERAAKELADAAVLETEIDMTVAADVLDSPTEHKTQTSPKKTGPKPVVVRVSNASKKSPHVVDLKDTSRAETLERVEVFREKYKTAHQGAAVDFATLIRKSKAPKKSTKKPAAFQVTPVAVSKAPTVASKRKAFAPNMPKQPRRKVALPTFTLPRLRLPQLPKVHFRPLAAASAMLALLVIIPFPALGYISEVRDDSAHIVAVSTEGFEALQASTVAAFTADMDGAADSLHTALGAFSTASNLLETEHTWLQSVASVVPVVGQQVAGRQRLLTAGHHMALGNTYLLKGVQSAGASPSSTLTDRLSVLESHLSSAVVQYDAALSDITAIPDSAIPEEYRNQAEEFQLLFGAFVSDMYDVIDLLDVMLRALGEDGYKKYLVMFQNEHELRPTGGFMGSFAVLEVQKGALSWDIPGGGTYDVQGQLTLDHAPPLPLQLMNNKWELQDANWWSHLPASASVIEDMYENSRGATVDGVFFVNSSVLVNLVDIVGPLQLSNDDIVNGDNILSYIEEKKVTDDTIYNEPKRVLSELLPSVLSAVEDGGQDMLMQLLLTFSNSLSSHDVQIFAHDDRIQETLREYGWTGEIRTIEPAQDYLHIVRTNLQGRKTDAVIDESVVVDTEITSDGSIINTLTITRTHTKSIDKDLYRNENISYLRSYVPEGSELISADGFEYPPESMFLTPSKYSTPHPLEVSLTGEATIDAKTGTYSYNEFDKTVFANWMIVPRGESRTAVITYRLPFTVDDLLNVGETKGYLPYTMIHQTQSGVLDSDIVHTITFPERWDVHWLSTDDIRSGGNFALYKSAYDTDMYYGMILNTN